MSLANIHRLAGIANKPTRTIVGLMSGTSLDGLDIALCTLTGAGFDTKFEVLKFTTCPYPQNFRDDVLACFARRDADLQNLTLLHSTIASTHADLVRETLAEWGQAPENIDLLASHGQTIYHAPRSLHGQPGKPDATLQLGDGDHMAVRTGIITCSDFRQKHIAAGGEGAPLAAYGDILLFTHDDRSRILINIGGIANFTFLPARKSLKAAFSSDIGPGNTIMDALTREAFPTKTFDHDGHIAKAGRVHEGLLKRLLDDPFLHAGFPKTTGPERYALEAFKKVSADIAPTLSTEDQMATLNLFTARSIADAVERLPKTSYTDIFLSGGGMHNPVLVKHLRGLIPALSVETTEVLGIDPDAKEALLFAVLANELVAGSAETLRGRLQNNPGITMGKISFPS